MFTFVVSENTPGYLPDVEPEAFDSWADAVRYANWLAEELEEQGYRVLSRSKSEKLFYSIDLETASKLHDLGRVIEVNKIPALG
jgi:hypothetical protein